MIESDQRVQYCINGRDLSQIKGKTKKGKSESTEARFPNLLNQYRVMIGMAALRKAQDNYNKKINAAISEATQNASIDIAQYMCNKIASAENISSSGNAINEQTPLVAPYSISYEVGAGLTTANLVKGGSGSIADGWNTKSGVRQDVTSSFDRESRICHVCRTVSSKQCKDTGSEGWVLIVYWDTTGEECETTTKDPVCEDIKM